MVEKVTTQQIKIKKYEE